MQDIEWYFTEPDAPWCGFENIFNARTWYDGEIDWPEIGEVEGAPRTYLKGDNANTGDVHGTADQWLLGAYEADAVDHDPCFEPPIICLPYPSFGGTVLDSEQVTQPIISWSDTRSYSIDSGADGAFWTVDLIPGNCCNYGTQAFWTLTDGPPDFNPIDPLPEQFVLGGTACLQGDVFASFGDEIIGMGWTLNPPPLIGLATPKKPCGGCGKRRKR